jgi:hypothetical protein
MIEHLLQIPPFELDDSTKRPQFFEAMKAAVKHHIQGNSLYAKQAEQAHFNVDAPLEDLSQIPFLPMALFKRISLRSVEEQQIVRVLHSSATTSQQPSRVLLDAITRQRQRQALVAVLSHYIGSTRQPFIVADLDPKSFQNAHGTMLPARQAALRGFLTAARSSEFLFTATPSGELELNEQKLLTHLQAWEHPPQTGCLFGFTYLIHQGVLEPLRRSGKKFQLPQMKVLHIGGWKKLTDRKISKGLFNQQVANRFGLPEDQILDIYGFTEQMGLIYPDCPTGFKHVPIFSEVLVREPEQLRVAPDGSEGLLQFLTPLPHSYPGISILTDDLGRITQRGRCSCGRSGTAFEVTGRADETQTRGCGDVLASELNP